ncbi:unnamed protein product [marine sediment metagenome]|uniref:Uncharacterized protein n=1 Tax=marine sediment metagenome TaxID=412755 RepID=X1FH18_9ZZZZ
MTRKITAFHIDISRGTARVRALSKSLRGTTFTLDAVEVKPAGKGKGPLKSAVAQAIEEAILSQKAPG